MDLSDLSKGGQQRLARIKLLRKGCSDKAALEFALVVGWLAAERSEQDKTKNLKEWIRPRAQ